MKHPCKNIAYCGGCRNAHTYQQSLGEKKKSLSSLFNLYNKAPKMMEPKAVLAYRRKVEWRARIQEGRMQLGYFKTGGREFLSVSDCAVLHPHIQTVLHRLTELNFPDVMNEKVRLIVHLYDRDTKVCLLAVGASQALLDVLTESAVVDLVFDRDDHPRALIPASTGHWMVPGQFMQSHVESEKILQNIVCDQVEDEKVVLELFCGNGHLLQNFQGIVKGYDIEIKAAEALSRKKHSFERLDLYNQRPEGLSSAKCIVADPGRPGLKSLAQSIGNSAAEKLVYVSCNIESLYCDSQVLVKCGFACEHWIVLDLFPWTEHFEVVATFARASKTSH